MSELVSRRTFVLASLIAAATAERASAEVAGFDTFDLEFDSDKRLARKCRVVAPKSAGGESLPVLVLLHGLGETRAERLGIDAWLTPYGAANAWERLERGAVRVDGEKTLSDAETAELEGAIARDPFAGLVLVCPFMPNPHAFPGGAQTMFARYAKWLEGAVLPGVRERVPRASRHRESTGLAGVSLGGYSAIELGIRASGTFGSVGTVQGAFSAAVAPVFARRLAEAAPALRGVYVSTSWFDPYRAANERLFRELGKRGVAARFSLRRGSHSQGWLREIGTLELLSWHDRALRNKLETGEVRAKSP